MAASVVGVGILPPMTRPPMTRALVALALVAALIPALPAASASAAPASAPGVNLAGQWRFSPGDDPAWAGPSFDDSEWATVKVPQLNGQVYFDREDGVAWFRVAFTVPSALRGRALTASLGRIDDADIAYLNGHRIGASGRSEDPRRSAFLRQRLYRVPQEVVRFGRRNVLAVRVDNFDFGGGIYDGPIGIFTQAGVRRHLYGQGSTSPASPAQTRAVQAVLAKQATALRRDDVRAYLSTLSPRFFHDGHTKSRRGRVLRDWLRRFGSVRLDDRRVTVVVNGRGQLVADTRRAWRVDAGGPANLALKPRDFLVFDADSMREIGNHARLFRDVVEAGVETSRRPFTVWLPPSYRPFATRRYPSVYLLHGAGGSNIEWEARSIEVVLGRMVRRRGVAESVVVLPDASPALWYADSSAAPWRTMFAEQLRPLIDREYRTIDRREMRAVNGTSMGGHGAFTLAWAFPDLFSSIGSHMGALHIPPLAGSSEDVARNSSDTPNVQVNRHTPEFLSRFTYYLDACDEDDFATDDATRSMSGQLTSKGIDHQAEVRPEEGGHTDRCFMPHLYKSFLVHTATWKANGLR